mmetsp:Transcript_144725/g.204723  ORF Transcript_144725/g.204723 Transcript_144725/m.204723 type:complete len:211 (+) Transcript_144725:199-831(+)
MCTFVSVDDFQVHHVTNDVVLIHNPVASKHISGCSRNIESFSARISFDYRNSIRNKLAMFVSKAANSKTRLLSNRNFSQHISHLHLNKLVASQRVSKLLSIKSVISSHLETVFSSAQSTPCDSKSRVVETTERTTQSFLIRKHILCRYKNIFHHDLPRNRRAQAKFSFNNWRRQAFHSFLENKTTNHAIQFRPHNENIRLRRVCDPRFSS